jgi:hypothetical protein
MLTTKSIAKASRNHKNLQPMWGPDNQKKGGAYDEEDKQNLIRRYNEENLS